MVFRYPMTFYASFCYSALPDDNSDKFTEQVFTPSETNLHSERARNN